MLLVWNEFPNLLTSCAGGQVRSTDGFASEKQIRSRS